MIYVARYQMCPLYTMYVLANFPVWNKVTWTAVSFTSIEISGCIVAIAHLACIAIVDYEAFMPTPVHSSVDKLVLAGQNKWQGWYV